MLKAIAARVTAVVEQRPSQAICRFAMTSLIVGWLSGCTNVQPWERGTLAKPHMALDYQPMQSELRRHSHESREAAAGGGSASGGGCGCY